MLVNTGPSFKGFNYTINAGSLAEYTINPIIMKRYNFMRKVTVSFETTRY